MQPPEPEEGLEVWLIVGIILVILIVVFHILFVVR